MGGEKSKSKQVAKKRKGNDSDNTEFILTHFPTPPLRKCFHEKFMSRSVITPFFVNLCDLGNLHICNKSLSEFLIDIGWKNVLVIKEKYSENLVKVFYSNMIITSEFSGRIVTNVGGIPIEFDVTTLNRILGTPNDGLELYSTRTKIDYPWFSIENAVRKICRRSDLSSEFCRSPLKSQALPLQTRILHYVLHHVITPRSGHGDEVNRLDVAIMDCILEGRVLNIGYIILHNMLNTPHITKKSLPYGSIITRILKFFKVPITEPTFLNPKELGDEAIANLGFIWVEDHWRKDRRYKNKSTELAPTDHRLFNDILPPDKLPDLSAPQRSYPPPSEGPSHSSSANPEDPMQQLLTEVHALSQQQSQLQSQFEAFQIQSISEQQRLFEQQQRLFAQQQQLLDGQQQLFAALGFPPPSSSSHPPSP